MPALGKARELVKAKQLTSEREHNSYDTAFEGADAHMTSMPGEPVPYGAQHPLPSEPEEILAPGTEIDEEWFSGDEEYWEERAQERAEESEPPRRWPRIVRFLVAVVASAALVVLMAVPFGGLAEFVDIVLNGVPAPAETNEVVPDAGSPANFQIQKSFNYSKGDEAPALEGAAASPRYFLTNAGEVTNVKLQSPWQSCWAFAAVAALESSVLKAQGSSNGTNVQMETPVLSGLPSTPDYSERHVAWFSHEAQSERAAGEQAGEGISFVEQENATQLTGGSLLYADTQFTTSRGIVAESDEPYCYEGYTENDIPWYQLGRSKGDVPAEGDNQDARNRDWSLSTEHVQDSSGVLVTGAHILPSPVKTKKNKSGTLVYKGYDKRATAAIKSALVEYGAVAISYKADVSKPGMELLKSGSGEHFSYDTWAQFDNSEKPRTNHAACIVGWDDDYAAENFTGTASGSPPANGAWLVKNSWGSEELFRQLGITGLDVLQVSSGLDRSGFFWLSYYDHTISLPYAFEVDTQEKAAALAHVYQYDYLAVSDTAVPVEASPAPQVANVFEAQDDEELYAVSARTYNPGARVQVTVVKLDEGAADPSEGTELATLDTTCTYGGFQVLELDEPIALKKGERFAVIEQVGSTADSGRGYLNLETVAYGTTETVKINVVANEGETFARFGSDSAWLTPRETKEQLAQDGVEIEALGSAMVKAYTRK